MTLEFVEHESSDGYNSNQYGADRDCGPVGVETRFKIMQPLCILQNVRQVRIGGLTNRHAGYMKEMMEGNSPVDKLPKMYDIVRKFVRPAQNCYEELEKAGSATKKNDAMKLKELRAVLAQRTLERRRELEAQLFDYDA